MQLRWLARGIPIYIRKLRQFLTSQSVHGNDGNQYVHPVLLNYFPCFIQCFFKASLRISIVTIC